MPPMTAFVAPNIACLTPASISYKFSCLRLLVIMKTKQRNTSIGSMLGTEMCAPLLSNQQQQCTPRFVPGENM